MLIQPTIQDRVLLRDSRPDGDPLMYQKWRDLLFLHWAFDPGLIQKTLPEGLYIDTFEDKAYIGIIPFTVHEAKLRNLPSIPGLSDFPELNLRTYVYDSIGRPGIWLYSLDIDQWLTAEAVKFFTGLPYNKSDMKSGKDENNRIFISSSREGTDPHLLSYYRYKEKGVVKKAEPGSLEFFLIERYIVFSATEAQTKLLSGRVYHSPYPVQDAELVEWDDNLFELNKLKRPDREPDHVIMSKGVDAELFPLEVINR